MHDEGGDRPKLTGVPPAAEIREQPESRDVEPVIATRPPPPPPGSLVTMLLPPSALTTALELQVKDGAVSQTLPPEPAPAPVIAQPQTL